MPAAKPIIPGERFARWTALETTEIRTYPSGTNIRFRLCQCDCGKIQFVAEQKLRSGHSRSCGCLQAEVTAKRSTKHGCAKRGEKTRLYEVWCKMLDRCTNENIPAYVNYGGRGITVCERWLKFENFLEDMGEPAPGLTIDRIDNDKGYFKENCAWKTPKEQARNRRSTVRIECDGLSLTLAEWSERLGISYSMLRGRYEHKWPVREMLTVPIGTKRKRNI
jgi:hypothetical protein